MSEKKPLSAGAILLGLILIALGTLVMLANLGILPFDLNLVHWWPLILVVLGVVHLWNNRNIFDFSGLFLILLGVVFLMATLGKICWSDVWRYWPAVLILLGLSIVFKRNPVPLPGSGRSSTASSEATVRVNNILAGSDRRINSQEFKGGDVSQHPGRHQARPAGSQAGAGRVAAHRLHGPGRRRDPGAARLAHRDPSDQHAGRRGRPHAAEPRRHGRQAHHQGLCAAGRNRDQELKATDIRDA